MLVERRRTLLQREDIVMALHAGHIEALGGEPSSARLIMASAQVCLETGNGRAMWNHNFGNITCAPSDGQDHFQLTAREGTHADASKTSLRRLCYVSYEHAGEGAAAYWSALAGRYARALAAFDRGDPAEAAATLRALGYYTAPLASYRNALTSLCRDLRPLVDRLFPAAPEAS